MYHQFSIQVFLTCRCIFVLQNFNNFTEPAYTNPKNYLLLIVTQEG